MHIEADLDPIRGQRLRALQDRLKRPLEEVLGVAIDAAFRDLEPGAQQGEPPSSLFEALDAIGFVGCIEDDEELASDYKSRIDFSVKTESSDK
ncbi:MAG: hypothetical protein GVY09_11575 [Gammaproteobacteria bacterium]|jgi:hypothetical protein|nr:hypothetical protein [Gammaproteobacteria bacterium]